MSATELAERFIDDVPVSGLSLRPRQIYLALSPKYVAVEIGDPLPAAGRDIEIADRKLDLRCHIRPIELWKFIDDIGGRRIVELLGWI